MSNTEIKKGLVIRTSHNIITVCIDTKEGKKELECRIKGKVLKECGSFYNPITPGDWVLVEHQKNSDKALVLSVEQRRNYFSRFNQKGNKGQLLAANVDLVFCITSPVSPPFRPRFIDRIILQADIAGIETIVVCNKIDLEFDDLDFEERLEEYSRIGYKVLRISAKTKEGLEELRSEIAGKTCVLSGQSGVGKSSIINALQPGLDLREGKLNEKYNRGVHTTTMSFLFELSNETKIIDTPGFRLFIPDGIKSGELIAHLKEFAPLEGRCSFGMSCSHKIEPGCKIMEAVDAGVIHEDRYESFLNMKEDLEKYDIQR
ncbi:MAG: ribosome small subunit-dependent GTPase A [Treponema sp.]|jgi:ribosome biogenesis GTPase|nr:ribosome small subunit-dependent GTPase A [Treponema sp.]